MEALVRLLLCALVAAVIQTECEAQDFNTDVTLQPTTLDPIGGVELDQNETCAIFGGPSCPTELPGLYNPCQCKDGSEDRCECVLFYQCDNVTGQYDEDGRGILDIRKNDGCPQVEFRCCKINAPHDKRSPEPTPHPDFPAPTPPPGPQDAKCGVRNEGGLNSRIVNNDGGEAGFGEFPWMAAILVAGRTPSVTPSAPEMFRCGGAILIANVILTAAHCVKAFAPHRLRVRAGEWDRESTSELYKHQDRGVSKVVIHDDYYGGNFRYDVAILVLDEPLALGYHIGTVCLPDAGDSSAIDGQQCIVTGWGKEKLEDRWPHRYLKLLDLAVVPRDQCESLLQVTALGTDFKLHESFVCAGGEAGKDTCKGDGGSPLVCPLPDGRYQLTGVVAWGVDCGLPGVPGLYANVPMVRSWLDEQLVNIDARSRKFEPASRRALQATPTKPTPPTTIQPTSPKPSAALPKSRPSASKLEIPK